MALKSTGASQAREAHRASLAVRHAFGPAELHSAHAREAQRSAQAEHEAGLPLHEVFGHEHERGCYLRSAAARGPQVQRDFPVSAAREAWEAERHRLADEFRPHKDRPTESDALNRYFAGSRAAWRAFAAAEPEEAERLFAENMFEVSRASANHTHVSRPGRPASS